MNQLAVNRKIVKKIIFISLQGIGDLILALPAFRSVKEEFPGVELFVLTLEKNRGVVDGDAAITEVFTYDGTKKGLAALGALFRLLLNIRREAFDASVCMYPVGLRSALIGYLSGAFVRVAQNVWKLRHFYFLFTLRVPVRSGTHAVEMNLDLVRALGVKARADSLKLSVAVSDKHRGLAAAFKVEQSISKNDMLIAIHAGAGAWGRSRLWPAENFAALADRLIDRYRAKVVFIGAAGEEKTFNAVKDKMRNKPVFFGSHSLKVTAVFLESCSLFIGNNSGPMHLAAAMKTPTLGIFGDTDPRIHRPFGGNNAVVRKGLDCSPCYYPHLHGTLPEARLDQGVVGRRFRCKKNTYECMERVEVDDVFAAAQKMIEKLHLHHGGNS